MKSHTGAVTSFGRGWLIQKSSKQKLNTKSSTEAELVGVSDYLPHCIWYRNFLEHQGYLLKDNIIHQDNQSAVRMEGSAMVEIHVLVIPDTSIFAISLLKTALKAVR